MAFEIFDDVGAYWFVLTLIGLLVIPRGVLFLLSYMRTYLKLKSKASNSSSVQTTAVVPSDSLSTEELVPCTCALCMRKRDIVDALQKKKRRKEFFSMWNIIYFILCIVFIYMLIKIPQVQQQKLASFDPYEILELDEGVGVDVVRKVRTHCRSFEAFNIQCSMWPLTLSPSNQPYIH